MSARYGDRHGRGYLSAGGNFSGLGRIGRPARSVDGRTRSPIAFPYEKQSVVLHSQSSFMACLSLSCVSITLTPRSGYLYPLLYPYPPPQNPLMHVPFPPPSCAGVFSPSYTSPFVLESATRFQTNTRRTQSIGGRAGPAVSAPGSASAAAHTSSHTFAHPF